MDRRSVRSWLNAYEVAWRTGGTSGLIELFSPDASYRTAPFEQPFVGLDEIAVMWEANRDGPEESFSMQSGIVAVDGETAVVRVDVQYASGEGQTYRDLWIIEFDGGGRCAVFEEWPFWPEGSNGTYARNPGRAT